MVTVTSWGRLSCEEHDVRVLDDRRDASGQLKGCPPAIAYGMGRSYGDACLNPGGVLWKTTALDRFISFDPQSGCLRCEAGVLLRDIQRVFIPQGWMLPVTPGTQLVTVGGAIANDVHGKNHHVFGSFGDHVVGLTLCRTDGSVIHCGPDRDASWFAATVGGLGLTGIIVDADLQLRRSSGPWLDTETIAYQDLDQFFRLADESEKDWEQTVSWIDCIGGHGRGIFLRANPSAGDAQCRPPKRSFGLPFTPPFSLINRVTLRPFNALYYHAKKRQPRRATAHHEPFSYPLDDVRDWNRAYGPRGFYQYQMVVPRAAGKTTVGAMLARIARSGQGSFLAVLKTFGDRESVGMLGFPRPGVTLALDFPNGGAPTLRLFDELDAMVRDAGGRIYPAKDARMSRAMFESGYPRLSEFLPYRDPGLSSAMSRRLMGA